MKIGYFVTEFPYINLTTGEIIIPPIYGGVENVTYNLALQMAKRGHEVFIFTTSIDDKDCTDVYGNIKIFRFKKNFTISQTPMSFGLIYKPLFLKTNLDVVHAHMGNLPAPFTAYLYSKKMNKKLVISYHGDWLGGFGGVLRRIGVFLFQKFFCDRLLRSADLIIGLSQNHVSESKFLKKYCSKIKIIPNGVNVEEFEVPYSKSDCRMKLSLPLDKNIVLFVGSLVPVKSIHTLVKSMKKVLAEFPDSYLVVVGDGICRDNLKTSCKNLGIESSVMFTGFIFGTQKILFYKSADLFVLPSISEGFPIVLLEATASGLPVIASNVGGIPSLIENGVNGFLVEPENPEKIAEKILFLLNDERLREEMSKNAKIYVKDFTWDKVAEETENTYLNYFNIG